MEEPNFQKSIVMFIWVSDVLTGVGKYRYAGLHGGKCVVVMLQNSCWLYGLVFYSFPRHISTIGTWTFPPAALSYLNNKVFFYLLILIVALGPNYYLLRNQLLYSPILFFTVVLTIQCIL